MNLYIMVRPSNDDQIWSNYWIENQLISISTSLEIVGLAQIAQNDRKWIYVHRTGVNGLPPLIVGKVQLKNAYNNNTLEFGCWNSIMLQPVTRHYGGQYYFDQAIDGMGDYEIEPCQGNRVVGENQIQQYKINGHITLGSINHPRFGHGTVYRVSNGQVEVLFQDGEWRRLTVRNAG